MKKNLVIIHKTQFGYHTGNYKFAEHLRKHYQVHFICYDLGHKKTAIEGVNVKYISYKGLKQLRGIRFLTELIVFLFTFNGLIFVEFFENCQILKLLYPRKKMILDIRTLSISKAPMSRHKYDSLVKKATKYFDITTIISNGLKTKLNLSAEKSAILPLGSDVISTVNKTFNNELRLLYIGTFNNRNIQHTIIGISKFLKQYKDKINVHYDIIGEGKEFEFVKERIEKENLTEHITLHGRIPHSEINSFFDNCNCGISFVPITEYFDHQPSTKSFEYVLSGIPCIATATYENKKIINDANGILCNDTPESFARAMEEFVSKSDLWNSGKIRSTLINHTWGKITNEKLLPILKSLE